MKSAEFKTFTEALEKVLSVSHKEIKKMEAEDKALRSYTSKKRGPKKVSTSGHAKDDKD